MTREECAAELFDLIVVKGRRQARGDSVFGSTYEELPEFMQEMWLFKADEFRDQNNFDFTEA